MKDVEIEKRGSKRRSALWRTRTPLNLKVVVVVVQPRNPTERFITDWLAAAPGFSVLVELNAHDERCVRIGKLQTWPTDRVGKGEATRALETLCHLADLHGVALCGDAEPYAKRPEDAIRLRLWLARYGFEPSPAEHPQSELFRPPHSEIHMPAVRA